MHVDYSIMIIHVYIVYLYFILQSPVFNWFIIGTIFLNALTIALETTPLNDSIPNVILAADNIFLGIYILEFGIKVYVEPLGYWRSYYNLFDFAILLMLVIHDILYAPLKKMSVDFVFEDKDFDQFQRDGYLVLKDFLTDEECDDLRKRCHEIVENEDFSDHPRAIFTTQNKKEALLQANTDYFITSGDKIRYFFEEGAIGEDGQLTVPKHLSLNKIGHALHEFEPAFKRVATCDKVKTIAKRFDFKHPAIVQSMYIFKQPSIGGSVVSHQDSTFLTVTPNTLLGFWIALEDADMENSCLWFAPGSQNIEVKRHLVRTVNDSGSVGVKVEGTNEFPSDSEFVPVPVKKGSLVLIHGTVVHKSEPNTSDRSRHIFTFHLFDSGVSKWSEKNWLQPSNVAPFRSLY